MLVDCTFLFIKKFDLSGLTVDFYVTESKFNIMQMHSMIVNKSINWLLDCPTIHGSSKHIKSFCFERNQSSHYTVIQPERIYGANFNYKQKRKENDRKVLNPNWRKGLEVILTIIKMRRRLFRYLSACLWFNYAKLTELIFKWNFAQQWPIYLEVTYTFFCFDIYIYPFQDVWPF